jgi:hypothetical protein
VAATHAVNLDLPDINRLDALTGAHPGVTTHMTLVAVVRLGLTLADRDPALLATELSAIHTSRRERRKMQLAKAGHGEDSDA